MEIGYNLYSSILLMGVVHGLFLAFALISTRSGNLVAHRLLAALTVVFVIDLTDSFFLHAEYRAVGIWTFGVSESLDFLYGPLIYLYIRALTDGKADQWIGKRWLHFLPFTASYLWLLPYFLLSSDQKAAFVYAGINSTTTEYELVSFVIEMLTFVSISLIGVYYALSIRRLRRHAREIREQFSYTERINLNWMRNLLIGLGAVYTVYLMAYFFSKSLGYYTEIMNLLMILIVILIYSMGYLGLRQPAIFLQNSENDDKAHSRNETEKPKSQKYKKSVLDSEMSAVLLNELKSHMVKEKPYLDNTLTLPRLSKQLDIPPHYLSQVINERLNQNFFDFINRYRVDDAKQHINNPEQAGKNILSIALDSGFNSKSAFYTAFKKHAGMTPTQFKQA
jgi:AraC-like DNA-binding protein